MDKKWGGDVLDIPFAHFEKMISTARDLTERRSMFADTKVNGENIFLRIGMSGNGIRPNYQVEFSNGLAIAINGVNHEEFDIEEFDRCRISKPYSIDQLKTT